MSLLRIRSIVVLWLVAEMAATTHGEVLVEFLGASKWTYSLSTPDSEWQSLKFDDKSWSNDRSPIGYNCARLAAKIPAQGDDGEELADSVFLRRRFMVEDLAQRPADEKLVVWLRFDDGALIAINGKEIIRENLPEGNLTEATRALKHKTGSDQYQFYRFVVDDECLRAGDNIITAQIYQAPKDALSKEGKPQVDLAFDLRLSRYPADALPPEQRTAVLKPAAKAAARAYHEDHYVAPEMEIPDGYVDGGRGMQLQHDGTAWSYREVITVDRSRDTELKKHIHYARSEELKQMDPLKRATMLAKHVHEIMTPDDPDQVLRQIVNVQTLYEGHEMLLGDIVRMCDSGVCRHRSLLYKILADEADLDVALVRGNHGPFWRRGGHAWNELHLGNGEVRLVDVMNPSPDFYFPATSDRAVRYYLTVKNKRWYERKKNAAPKLPRPDQQEPNKPKGSDDEQSEENVANS